MIISRKEAILLCSFIKMTTLTEKERKFTIESALAEKDLSEKDVKEQDKNKYLRIYIGYGFADYTNAYLQLFLNTHLQSAFDVRGKRQKLYNCACCGYKTLKRAGEYFICEVCFWENDGCTDENNYSGPNHMTLCEAKKNFLNFKASKERSLVFLDKDRFAQFATDINFPEIP